VPNDLRYSLRYIRKHAVESAAVVLSFALGIGASASVLSTVDSLLFRPPPRVLNPESVKRIYFRRLGATVEQTGSATSYPLYLEFARRSHSLTAIAAMSSARTSTSASAITIMWTLIRKPDQMSGSACRNANGSANAWRTRCTPRPGYLRTGIFDTSIANHFC